MTRTATPFAQARASAVDTTLAAPMGCASCASVPALVAGFCLIPFACLADRPLVSETADVIDRGACQVEAAASHSRASGAPKLREWSGVITCGTAFDTQPALTYASSRVAGEKEEVLLLGAKTTLQMPEHGRPGYGIAYSVGGVKVPGTSWRREEFNVTGLFTAEIAPNLLGHANLGWNRSRSLRQDTTLWSLGVETVGDFTVAADVFGDDRGRPSVSAGAGWVVGKGLSVNAAYATRFDSPRVNQLSVGAKLVF